MVVSLLLYDKSIFIKTKRGSCYVFEVDYVRNLSNLLFSVFYFLPAFMETRRREITAYLSLFCPMHVHDGYEWEGKVSLKTDV